MKSLLPFIKIFKKQLWWMLVGVALSFLTILAGFGLLSLSGWFISASAYAGLSYAVASTFNFFLPATGVRFFSLMRIINRYADRVVSHEATFKVLSNIRVWFYKKLEPLAPAHLMRYQSGDMLACMVGDIDALDNLYIRVLAPSVVAAFIALVVLLCFGLIDWQIAWITFSMMLGAAFLVPFFTGRLARNTSQQIAIQQAALKTSVVEYAQGLAELKTFSQDRHYLQKLADKNNQLVSAQQKMSVFSGLSSALISLALGATIVLVMWVAVKLVSHHQLNGAFIALLALGVIALFEAVAPLPVAYQYLGKTITSAKRLLNIIDHQPAVVFSETKKLELAHYGIAYKSVSFAYEGRTHVFQDLKLTIPQGQKLAITGCTGVGKSTLIQLLARFWDVTAGEISIGGTDIRKFSEVQLRQLMTVISQKSYIFNASIRDNLLMAREDASDDMLWHVLKQVDLDRFVKSLPEGSNTWTGEHGKALSGGQGKRLVLARAILKDAPILILDEPTEGLDKITEQKVFTALENIMQNKTVIVITHNAQLMQRMDCVFDIDQVNGSPTF